MRTAMVIGVLAGFVSAGSGVAQTVGTCRFNIGQLAFQGDAKAQASCLLRQVKKWGAVESHPADLPKPLADLIGTEAAGLRSRLAAYLGANGLKEQDLGGPLSAGVSHAKGGQAGAPVARYFVIHDTSAPYLGNVSGFPADIDASAAVNRLAHYAGSDAVAHLFVNRKGETLTGHDFSVPWRATKFETSAVGKPAKGLFLHVELIQPRRRDPAGAVGNDAIAPAPGFSAAQYDKLALIYAMASARAGAWLIPAFHAALDQGISDAHDDPQNFEMDTFAAALDRLTAKLH